MTRKNAIKILTRYANYMNDKHRRTKMPTKRERVEAVEYSLELLKESNKK